MTILEVKNKSHTCINDALTDDELRAILMRLSKEDEKDLFGMVCKRWLRLQSTERRKLKARAGPWMLRSMAKRFSGVIELDLSQSESRSFYPGVTDKDLEIIASGFQYLKILDLRNCKGWNFWGLFFTAVNTRFFFSFFLDFRLFVPFVSLTCAFLCCKH